jgi:RNA polymerase sigma-70 factor (ECF subfamily)
MDRDEVSQAYRRLGPMTYRRCLRLLCNPESARDATQEVFVRALRHAHKLPPDRECLPWLYRVATNHCLNRIRDGRRLEFRRPEDLPDSLQGPGTERWLSARQRLVALLDRVDATTARIAVYAHMDGMTQEEIAEVTGLSRANVSVRLVRIKQKLRQLLLAKGYREGQEP